MTKHFVVIAPNLTVFERLKEDFGDGAIFDRDPLICQRRSKKSLFHRNKMSGYRRKKDRFHQSAAPDGCDTSSFPLKPSILTE